MMKRRPFRTNQSHRTLSNSRVIHLNWDGNKLPSTSVKPPAILDQENNNILVPLDLKKTDVKTNLNGNILPIANLKVNNSNSDLKLPNVEVPIIENGSTVNLQIIEETPSLSVNRIITPVPPRADLKPKDSQSNGQLLFPELISSPKTLGPEASVSREGSWYNPQPVIIEKEQTNKTSRRERNYTNGALVPTAGSFM